mgnify:CR=1 FL=1
MNNTLTKWLGRNASTILTCIGAGGMIGTVVLAVKATPEAKKKIEEAHAETTKEIIEACWKDYIPTAAAGIGTLVCFFGANALNRKQQASLISAYAALDKTFRKYRKKVDDIFGEGADKAVMHEVEKDEERDEEVPWDDVQTFYIPGHNEFFESTMRKVQEAEYHLNRNFILRGCAPFNEFLEFLGLEQHADERIGWDRYSGEAFYGYPWIDFYHETRVLDDGLQVVEIRMPFMPHFMDADYGEPPDEDILKLMNLHGEPRK